VSKKVGGRKRSKHQFSHNTKKITHARQTRFWAKPSANGVSCSNLKPRNPFDSQSNEKHAERRKGTHCQLLALKPSKKARPESLVELKKLKTKRREREGAHPEAAKRGNEVLPSAVSKKGGVRGGALRPAARRRKSTTSAHQREKPNRKEEKRGTRNSL